MTCGECLMDDDDVIAICNTLCLVYGGGDMYDDFLNHDKR